MDEPKFTIEEIDDPVFNARLHAEGAQFKKNMDWLSSHWAEVLPRASGKFVAVAGQEAFVADDPLEAERLATAAHPEDKGVFVKYVNPKKGIRLYGNRRRMAT
jgi:hypothetical protein